MRFTPGTPKPATSGRRKGAPNKLSQSARDAFQFAFDQAGGAAGLAEWAQANRAEFYRLYARLIPVEHTGEAGAPIPVVVRYIQLP
jgi:hypothetical protein